MAKLLSANSRLVPEADKKSLRKGGPLDRSNLDYLMREDPQLRSIVYNQSNTAVFVDTVEHTFSLVQRTNQQVLQLGETFR